MSLVAYPHKEKHQSVYLCCLLHKQNYIGETNDITVGERTVLIIFREFDELLNNTVL